MKRKIIRFSKWFVGLGLVLVNLMAAFHAYNFAHPAPSSTPRPKTPDQMTWTEKAKALFFGVKAPKAENKRKPVFLPYTHVFVESNGKKLSGWFLRKTNAKGTVLIFHGHLSCKSLFLSHAHQFYQMGYQVFLLDLEAHGDSEGETTSFGYQESDNVRAAVEMVNNLDFHEGKMILFGTSLGAVAVMKALSEGVKADLAMLECPFGSFQQTVRNRFATMNLPAWGVADLLILHGSLQQRIWYYGHNPTEYAQKIQIPTLILYGIKDKSVTKPEIETIYANLAGKKSLTYLKGDHNALFLKDSKTWIRSVKRFLEENDTF